MARSPDRATATTEGLHNGDLFKISVCRAALLPGRKRIVGACIQALHAILDGVLRRQNQPPKATHGQASLAQLNTVWQLPSWATRMMTEPSFGFVELDANAAEMPSRRAGPIRLQFCVRLP